MGKFAITISEQIAKLKVQGLNLDCYEEKKLKAQDIKAQIDKTDAAIDQMVYELYGLSDEEIGIVENN